MVSLITLAKTLAVTFGLFFLLLLVYSDTLEFWNHGEDIFLYIFLGLFFYLWGTTGYVFGILLPMYYIDRKHYPAAGAHEGIQRRMPVASMFLLVFAGFAALIAGAEGGFSEGIVVANFFNVFVTAYTGLIFFEYQVHAALAKSQPLPQQ